MAKRKKNRWAHPDVVRLVEQARRLADSESAPRKHHLVPRSYLKRWAEDEKIRVTDVEKGTDYKTSPAKAARETDYYSLAAEGLDPDELPPLLFEVLLDQIERWGVEGIEHLLEMPLRPDPQVTARFTWFLGMTMTRGNSMRHRLRMVAQETMRVAYGGVTRDGVRSMISAAGDTPTDDDVDESMAFIEKIRAGTVRMTPQEAALVGLAANLSFRLGEELIRRPWTLFETPKVLVTCDEPVVTVGGPGHRRDERAGLETSGVVVFPLTPGLVLVMFHPVRAARLGVPLDHLPVAELELPEVHELNREIAMNCHRWIFERPTKRVGPRLQVPPDPGSAVFEERPDLQAIDHPEGEVIRVYGNTRWPPGAPWPVDAWWA